MLTTKLPGFIKSDQPERLVAVVTPIPSFPISAEAEISIRHLRKFLGHLTGISLALKACRKSFQISYCSHSQSVILQAAMAIIGCL